MRLTQILFMLAMVVSSLRGADLSGVTVSPAGSGNLKAASLTASNLTTTAMVGTDSQKKMVSSTLTVAEANALHGVPLASAASVAALSAVVAGKQDAFLTGVGITNKSGVLSINIAAGANITLSTNANGQIVIASSGGGGGGGPISDGNYGDITVSGTGTIFTINANVVGNTKLAQMAQGTVKLRPSTAGLGNPTDGTALPWDDTGDVARLAESRVLTIQPGRVTLAMQANMATASFVGRNTAGVGPPEILQTLPNTVQDNITRLGTVTSGSFTYSLLPTRTLTAGPGLTGGGTLAADRTFTLDMSTFVNSLTIWDSSQATRTITFGLSGSTDPVMTIGDNSIDITTGVFKVSGNTVATLNGTETLVNKTLTSPTLTTPALGVATATSINGTTIPASKTLVVTTDTLAVHAATTSAQLAGVLGDETGTGAAVFANTPTLVTPVLGVATATSVNGTTIPSSKTLVVTTDTLAVHAATTSAQLAGVLSDETGTGAAVFANTPTLVTPNIGAATGTSLVLSGDLTAQTLSVGGATHTNSSLTLFGSTADIGFTITNNAAGNYRLSLPTTGLSGAYNFNFSGSNVTFAAAAGGLASTDIDTSAELAALVTDETGSGALVFANTPTLITPVLGVATATTINKLTLTAPATAATITVVNNKTFTVNKTLTLDGTDSTTMTFPGTSQSILGQTDTATVQNKTISSTSSGGNNTLKFTDYKDFIYPHRVDGTGVTIVTNDYTSALSGLATYAGTGGTNANYAIFRIGTVPLDLDTSVEMKLRNLAFRVSGTDTGSASFSVAVFSTASSSAYSPSDFTALSTYLNFTTGTLTSPAANDIFYFADVTLTGWAAGVTAGRPFLIAIARDGTDANNDSITLVGGTIEYARTK